jgi:hypothetical protein
MTAQIPVPIVWSRPLRKIPANSSLDQGGEPVDPEARAVSRIQRSMRVIAEGARG